MRGKLLWRLYPSYLLVVLLSMTLFVLYSMSTIRKSDLNRSMENLSVRARLLESLLAESESPWQEREAMDALCRRVAARSGAQMSVYDADGNLLGASEPFGEAGDSTPPEVQAALNRGMGNAVRFDVSSRNRILSVAVAGTTSEGETFFVRTSMPLRTVWDALGALGGRILFGSIAIVLVVTGVSYLISRNITRPIEELRQGADRFAAGHLETRLSIPETEEIGSLAFSMNRMAAQLSERIQTVEQQRNELQTVLSSMVEGVIVVDPDKRISRMNEAAAQLLEVDPNRSIGRNLLEVVRNTDLHHLLSRTLESNHAVESEIALYDRDVRFLQVHGTRLLDVGGAKSAGALIVMNDVTAIRKLESVRRQFVANVSHELKTPITSIKGFVETLLEGAMHEPEEAHRFLSIISRHADRLGAIIEDLLALSRIELNLEKEAILLEKQPVRESLAAAILDCEIQARERNVSIQLECAAEMTARINAPLIEQAVSNLIDNAIKYSDPGNNVEVSCAHGQNGEIIMTVRDHGWGISEEHLSRIFERFYRVDRGRSRKMGGTGLGLAIVKHIAQAHRGRVDVESRIGEGSVFSIRLPGESKSETG